MTGRYAYFVAAAGMLLFFFHHIQPSAAQYASPYGRELAPPRQDEDARYDERDPYYDEEDGGDAPYRQVPYRHYRSYAAEPPPGYHWFYRPYSYRYRHPGYDPYARYGRAYRPAAREPAVRIPAREPVKGRPSKRRERVIELLRVPLPEPRGGRTQTAADIIKPDDMKTGDRNTNDRNTGDMKTAGIKPGGPGAIASPFPMPSAAPEPGPRPFASVAEQIPPPRQSPKQAEKSGQELMRRDEQADAAAKVSIVAKTGEHAAEQRTNTAGKSDILLAPVKPPAPPALAAKTVAPPPPPIQAVPAELPDDDLTRMIGQLLFVGFEGQLPTDPGLQKLLPHIRSGHAGGVIIRAGNIRSPQQLQALTEALKAAGRAHPQLLIGIDQEGGRVQRLERQKGFQQYPSASELGQASDPLKAHAVYAKMAAELRDAGINVNFGPVADLSLNAGSPLAIKDRSYGPDPRHVTAYAKAFAIAHRDAGVLTVMKHFPGLGSVAGDTHAGSVDATGAWREAELVPYRELAHEKFADMVMVGHISHAQFSDDAGRPASLSKKAVQTELRGKLGYEGITITDDLAMPPVAAKFSFEESLILALEAGNDMLLLGTIDTPPEDVIAGAVTAIRSAVLSGRLPQARIRASFDRITAMKRRLEKLQTALSGRAEKQAVREAAKNAVSRQ